MRLSRECMQLSADVCDFWINSRAEACEGAPMQAFNSACTFFAKGSNENIISFVDVIRSSKGVLTATHDLVKYAFTFAL